MTTFHRAHENAAEENKKSDNLAKRTKYIGCILGGAIGDALGAPIEFMSIGDILHTYGPDGVTDYVEYTDGTGEITDDTQMTLFTAEGLLRAYHRGMVKGIEGAQVEICWHSYLRWLYTQQGFAPETIKNDMLNGWLIEQKELFRNRAPGNTCLSALRSEKFHTIEKPANNSKGCGTVMRMAPAGLIYAWSMEEAFKHGAKISATTHGHPSGYLSGGVLAAIIYLLDKKKSLNQAIADALKELSRWDGHEELLGKIEEALEIHRLHQHNNKVTYREIEQLGGGWVAEEALAISLLCALQHPDDFETAVIKAINHSGDCDSTGAITGNIVGMMVGEEGIPERWKRNLRYKHIIEQIAHDLWLQFDGETEATSEWAKKYPPY